MSTMVRDAGATVARPRAVARPPRLGSVASTAVERTPERTSAERLARASILGGLIGFLLMGAGVYAMSIAAGADAPGALGVAAFCAVWGGLGFGCLLGAIANAAWEERLEARAAAISPSPPSPTTSRRDP